MYHTIVVGTDGSPTARRAVAHAAQLAAMCDATLHVVHAYRPEEGTMTLDVTTPAEWAREVEVAARQTCHEAAMRAVEQGAKVEQHTYPGDPADALIAVAEQTAADLIVVGNRGMSGIRRFVLGSVPNKVSHHSPCNVLILRTDIKAPALTAAPPR